MAGLSCAAALGDRAECHVFERLPVPGGEAWEDPRVAARVEAARRAGMRFLGGTQVLRFHAGRLLALGQHTTRDCFAALVIATGHRPLTRAELEIGGARCAGVLPATVAGHLLHHGVNFGRVAVVGDAAALPLVDELLAGAHRVSLVLPDGRPGGLRDSSALDLHENVWPVELGGSPRVEWLAVSRTRGEPRERLRCDSVVLAYGRVPYRNVEGAVFRAPGVVFAQAGGGLPDGEQSEAVGVAAGETVLRLVEGAREATRLGAGA
jgi:hypothetical protein